MNWIWIHRWFSENLVEPFFQAEMHRVKMQLRDDPDDKKKVKLHLVEGRKQDKYCSSPENKKIQKAL
ncbi:MAG TPA: hypothetical protein DEF34_10865 [Desulfotomaculum sp.]|nr:MAG: hypothetical protein VR67_00420 [Peptococcaceae bacterium BRH_c8a]KJS70729.1 MAG: hypothetical protein JL56_16475 [Desulfotomaculum sp. BICA1-6]HBX24113.1 hypothetical protein [Desulfotomaculum sp.]